MQKILIIDNVRSAYNVGSMFRTSDGAGVSHIILVGYTPAPIDRFGRVQPEIAKTSLGASSMLAWEKIEGQELITARINDLKNDGFVIVAVEQTKGSVSLHDFTVPEKVAYVLGNEIEGVSEHLLALADVIVHIPMRGKKESLNVAVAAGIVVFYQ